LKDIFREQEQININELAEKMELLINEVGLLKKKFDEEMDFIKGTEEAWQSYDRGEFIFKSKNEFLEELEKC